MTETIIDDMPHGTARIYQFPLRGRIAGRRDLPSASDLTASPAIADVSSAAWYHEAAIAESRSYEH